MYRKSFLFIQHEGQFLVYTFFIFVFTNFMFCKRRDTDQNLTFWTHPNCPTSSVLKTPPKFSYVRIVSRDKTSRGAKYFAFWTYTAIHAIRCGCPWWTGGDVFKTHNIWVCGGRPVYDGSPSCGRRHWFIPPLPIWPEVFDGWLLNLNR